MKAVLFSLVAAYLLPGWSVLRKVADARDDLSLTALKAEGQAQLAPSVAPDIAAALGVPYEAGSLSVMATWSMKLPGRCRFELSSLESTRVVAATSNGGKRRTEGVEVPALAVATEHLCAFLAVRGGGEGETRAAFDRHLQAMKVDVRKVSLGRFAGQVALVLGAADAGAPQFWVHKEKFLPTRVRQPEGNGPWDVRLFDYGSSATGDWFPRVVEVWKGNDLALRFSVLKADAKPTLPDSLF